MRQRRAKTYRKLMSLYSLSFGFRQPYQVLVDSDMCRLAVAAKTDLQHQLSTVLQGTVKPMITQCCIHELYLQGKSQQAVVDLAKSFERRKCNHRQAIPGDECIATVVGMSLLFSDACNSDILVGDSNKHRYVIAAQSRALRAELRLIPGVPIVHVNRAVMILEPPSDATLEAKQRIEEQASQPTAAELATIHNDGPVKPVRRHRGPKGPNPLSVKKKAVPSPRQRVSSVSGGKRKRDEVGEDTTERAVRKRKRRRKQVEGNDKDVPNDYTPRSCSP